MTLLMNIPLTIPEQIGFILIVAFYTGFRGSSHRDVRKSVKCGETSKYFVTRHVSYWECQFLPNCQVWGRLEPFYDRYKGNRGKAFCVFGTNHQRKIQQCHGFGYNSIPWKTRFRFSFFRSIPELMTAATIYSMRRSVGNVLGIRIFNPRAIQGRWLVEIPFRSVFALSATHLILKKSGYVTLFSHPWRSVCNYCVGIAQNICWVVVNSG